MEFAADYIAFDLKNPTAAVNTVQGIRKQINKLQNFPERGYIGHLEWKIKNIIQCLTIELDREIQGMADSHVFVI